MIKKYSFKLSVHKGEKISFEDAYPLYAELLEGVEDSSAAMMHEKEKLSLSQYLQPIDGGNAAYWNIVLFGAEEVGGRVIALHEAGEILPGILAVADEA